MPNTTNTPESNYEKYNDLTQPQYWDQRYVYNDTPWDIGYPSTPIATYIDQLTDKSQAIMLPGAGNGYEVAYLINKGFTNVSVVEFSETACNHLRNRLADKAIQPKIIQQDFFEHSGNYDLIIEQTFFCAIKPEQRTDYAQRITLLLKDTGKLTGVLFDKDFKTDGPPFGGHKAEYEQLFSMYFKKVHIEPCYNSIRERAGAEVFINISEKRGK